MRYLAKEISPHTFINIMPQYHPAWKVSAYKYPEINRPTTPEEVEEATEIARQEGLYRFNTREPIFKVFLGN
jgi:putative pyruvate formate lyase activating enzyme